jgi:hypothetical protein
MAQAASSAASDKGDHDVGGVSVEVLSGAMEIVVVLGSAWRAANCTSRSGTPASNLVACPGGDDGHGRAATVDIDHACWDRRV